MDSLPSAALQHLLRQETRSLLQYTSESYPWSKAGGHAACAAVIAMAQAEAAAVARLARWLAKQHLPLTFSGAYPMHFTTVNFVDLRYLLPRLADEQRQQIAAVQQVYLALPDGEGKALLRDLLELKKRHLEQLLALQAPMPPAAVAS